MRREACTYGPFRAWYAGWLHMRVLAGPWHSYPMYRPARSEKLSRTVRPDLYGGVTPLTSRLTLSPQPRQQPLDASPGYNITQVFAGRCEQTQIASGPSQAQLSRCLISYRQKPSSGYDTTLGPAPQTTNLREPRRLPCWQTQIDLPNTPP